MTFSAAVFYILSHWVRHKSDVDEAEADRAARLQTTSESVAVVCDHAVCYGRGRECRAVYHDRAECAGGLIVLADIESGFAEHVHAGKCGPRECDGGRAVGLWQTHRVWAWNDLQWASLRGYSLAATSATAAITARFLAGGVGRCGTLAGSFGLYQSGHRCNAFPYESAARRAETVAEQIRVLMARPDA